MIKIGILLIGLFLFISSSLYLNNNRIEKHYAEQIAISFLNSLSKNDREAAIQYVWPDTQLYRDLKDPKRYVYFEDSKVLEISKVHHDSAEGRPEYYQAFHRIISAVVKIEILYPDDVDNPPANRLLFIILVQTAPQADWRITELGSGP